MTTPTTLSTAHPKVTLSGTIDANGSVDVVGGATFYAAVFGPSGADFTLTNKAIISQQTSAPDSYAIILAAAGTIINKATIESTGSGGILLQGTTGSSYVLNKGYIRGATYGIVLDGAGAVNNAGTVSGGESGIVLQGAGSVYNYGSAGGAADGIAIMGAGGYAYNAGDLSGSQNGIDISESRGDAYNTGQIDTNIGILLGANGTATNAGHIDGGRAGIQTGPDGTVINTGTVSATDFGIYLYSASFDNSGLVTGLNTAVYDGGVGAAVYNGKTGTIAGGPFGIMVTQGSVGNAGSVTAISNAITVVFAPGTVTNSGDVTAVGKGVDLNNGGTVTNSGTITSTEYVAIRTDGTFASVYNTKTGVIDGHNAGILMRTGDVVNAGTIDVIAGYGIYVFSGAGTLTNSGLIAASDTGIMLGHGGLVDNTGTISAATGTGILVSQGGTIIESGGIDTNGGSYAIYFDAGFAASSRLILSPTAHLTGPVQLNGSALNFAAATGKIGTFAPASQDILNAGAITIDSGAVWDIAGTFTTGSDGTLVNDGTIKEGSKDLITFNGPITGKGVIDLSKKTLTFNAGVASTQKISFSGTGEILALADPSAFDAQIEKFKTGDTIDLTGVSLSAITATHFVHSVLTLDEGGTTLLFTFANPGTFGTDIFELSAAGHGTAITLAQPGAVLPVTQITTLAPLTTLGS